MIYSRVTLVLCFLSVIGVSSLTYISSRVSAQQNVRKQSTEVFVAQQQQCNPEYDQSCRPS
jgi:hypothetical protein